MWWLISVGMKLEKTGGDMCLGIGLSVMNVSNTSVNSCADVGFVVKSVFGSDKTLFFYGWEKLRNFEKLSFFFWL